jgi:integrase
MAVKLKYVDRFVDRHGAIRYYFRRPKGKRIPLPGMPGSAEFIDAYKVALGGGKLVGEQRPRGDPGTFARLAIDYFASSDFQRLKPNTKRGYRSQIERFVAEHGHRLVADLKRDHVKKIIAAKADTPGAANDLLKKLRILIKFAIEAKWRLDDPTIQIKKFKGGEHHTWSEEEIAAFEARWPLGSRARTAFALHLFTGQRLSDVCRMAWPDIESDVIRVVQDKTGAKLWIPLHRELKAALDAWPKEHVAILTTGQGRPFTAKGFGNWMADVIGAAGVPDHCVLHGLRKAAARRLAEAGCSAKEIASITGHASLVEVERYTKAADQKRLARAAVARQERGGGDAQ